MIYKNDHPNRKKVIIALIESAMQTRKTDVTKINFDFFNTYKYSELIQSLVIKEMRESKNINNELLADKYEIGVETIRYIRRTYLK